MSLQLRDSEWSQNLRLTAAAQLKRGKRCPYFITRSILGWQIEMIWNEWVSMKLLLFPYKG